MDNVLSSDSRKLRVSYIKIFKKIQPRPKKGQIIASLSININRDRPCRVALLYTRRNQCYT